MTGSPRMGRPLHWVAGILAAYIVVFYWLACRKLDVCTSQSGDIATVNWMYYTSLHGKLFWHLDTQGPAFEMHQEPLIALYWPIYALVPGPKTLLFVQTLSIAAAGFAAFLISRRVLADTTAATFGMLAFLFYPSIVSQNVNQLHTSVLPLPFLVFAFYFFQIERFWPFVACALLACLGKENTALTVAMFLPYATIQRRQRKWVLAPGALALVSLLLSFKVIQPFFAQGRSYIALENLSPFGNSLGEVARNMLAHPGKVLGMVVNGKIFEYLILLLQPLGFLLPLFSPAMVFVLPDWFTNVISTNDGMRVLAWHYNVNVGAFLVVAAICSLPRWEKMWPSVFGSSRARTVVAACLFIFSLANWGQWFNRREYAALPWHNARVRALDLIPEADSVIAGPGQIVGHVSQRDVFTTPERVWGTPEEMFKFNWILFDMNYTLMMPGAPRDMAVPRETLEAFGTNQLYELVFRENNVFVFKRRQPIPPSDIVLKRKTRFY